MRLPTVSAVLMSIVLATCGSPGAENGVPEATRYLEQYGLEEIHATYARFFTLLSQGKVTDANQLLADSLPVNVNPTVRDQVLRATAGLSAIFDRGVEDAELIGLQRISGKAVALYYVLNTNSGPVLVTLMPFRQHDRWRTHTWMLELNAPKIIEALRGVGRFPAPEVIPFRPRDMTT